MKLLRSLAFLLALAGLSQAGTFFFGVTAAQAAGLSQPQTTAGDQIVCLYADGPLSGTWSATVHFWQVQGDGELSLISTITLTQAGPNVDGSGSSAYDKACYNVRGGTQIYADVTNVTGTIPAPGLYAENR